MPKRQPPPPEEPKAAPPEKKFGPYPGGISVNVWLNTVEMPEGPQHRRAVTISPRSFIDRQSGEWRTTFSYRLRDLPVLIFALSRALEYVSMTPLPGGEHEHE